MNKNPFKVFFYFMVKLDSKDSKLDYYFETGITKIIKSNDQEIKFVRWTVHHINLGYPLKVKYLSKI